MFDEIITDELKAKIEVVPGSELDLDEKAFAKALLDSWADVPANRKETRAKERLATYIARNWPETLRSQKAINAVPWVEVLKQIDVDEFIITSSPQTYTATGLAPASRREIDDYKKVVDSFTNNLRESLRTKTAQELVNRAQAEGTELPVDEAVAQAENLPDSSLATGIAQIAESLGGTVSVEESLRKDPTLSLTSLEAGGAQLEEPIDFSNLPGFATLGATNEFDLADTLSYPANLDKTQRKRLQDILSNAGYFDQAKDLGHLSARDGTMDTATSIAWQGALADSILNKEGNLASWLGTKTKVYKDQELAMQQEIYRDPAEIGALVDTFSFRLLNRQMEGQEKAKLMTLLDDWQKEALRGPTYTEERYQVDLAARAKEYFDRNFIEERMRDREREYLQMIGELNG